MGSSALMDLRAFRTPQLHRQGINVVVPVLPLHGPRASGRVRGEDLMTIDLVDSMHGMAQATWDVRRVIRGYERPRCRERWYDRVLAGRARGGARRLPSRTTWRA